MALFVNGAQGGMITADNRNLDRPKDSLRGYWNDSRTWDECLRIGHLMADEALRIVGDAAEQRAPRLICDSIFLFRANLDPFIHRDRSLLQQDIFDGSTREWIFRLRALRASQALLGLL
jgi:hypothetical protein